jgi:hypothetical protein
LDSSAFNSISLQS